MDLKNLSLDQLQDLRFDIQKEIDRRTIDEYRKPLPVIKSKHRYPDESDEEGARCAAAWARFYERHRITM